jgi:hypothetical protein
MTLFLLSPFDKLLYNSKTVYVYIHIYLSEKYIKFNIFLFTLRYYRNNLK